MSIKALQHQVRTIRESLGEKPVIRMALEEWQDIQRILSDIALCAVCRARVEQALQSLSTLKPIQGGFTKQAYDKISDTVFFALEPCMDCRVIFAQALYQRSALT